MPKQSLSKVLSAVSDDLIGAKLPSNPSEVIGRLYCFSCEHGSHHHILVGSIQAIHISDEGGFQLQVSNTTIWGQKIKSIIYQGRKRWAVMVEQEKLTDEKIEKMTEKDLDHYLAERFIPGLFKLL